MEEIWKAIPGYEGLYEASTLGRIRSAEGKTTSSARFPKRVWKQRIIKQKFLKRKSAHGLADARVCLWKDGKEKTFLVSRLVAMTFCTLPFEKFTVNHINGNPSDNRAENLEWVTRRENIQLGFSNGLYDNLKKPVCLFDESFKEKKRFQSMADAGRYLGKNEKYISNAISKCLYVYDQSKKRYIVILDSEVITL